MTRVGAAALGLAAIVLIACGTSKVADEAQVNVSGRLLLPSGAPANGGTVGLLEEPDGLSALVELTATLSTVGLLCLTKAVTICQGARKTTTGADGHFAFTMSGKDSKNVLGNPARFQISAQLPSGAQVQTRFELTTSTIAVPTTTFWEPAELSAVPAADFVTYSFSPFPASSGYRLSLTRSDETIWSQQGPASGRIDARVLADAEADFHAVATVEKPGVGVVFTTDYHTPRISLRGKASPPPSRDAPCSVAGASAPQPLVPCTLTDGQYAATFASQSCPAAATATPPTPAPSPKRCQANTFVQVDLGAVRPISAVFLYGLGMSAQAVVEVSADGVKWTRATRLKSVEYLAVTLPAGTSGRFVRLKSSNETLTIFSLTEFAVY
jgi:hypothetical protein